MGFFSKLKKNLFDDILGLDPGGGGIYKVARDVLGDKVADDILGMDPTGKGAVKFYNTAIPLAAGYYGAEALGLTGAPGAAAPGAAGAEALTAADIAGGLVPEFGTNALYDSFMTSAMTPEALASLAATAAAAPEVIGSGALLTDAAAAAGGANL